MKKFAIGMWNSGIRNASVIGVRCWVRGMRFWPKTQNPRPKTQSRSSDFGELSRAVIGHRSREWRTPVKGKEGYTLIEIILVLVIIGVLAGILIEPFRLGVKSYIGIETRADLTSQAREATVRIVREMRNIQKKANDKPNITSADATSITFADNEGITISFSLSGSTVLRDTNILADKVSSLDFRYFKGDNTALTTFPLSAADLDDVRRILVILTMQENTETVTMTGQAFLRDLRGL